MRAEYSRLRRPAQQRKKNTKKAICVSEAAATRCPRQHQQILQVSLQDASVFFCFFFFLVTLPFRGWVMSTTGTLLQLKKPSHSKNILSNSNFAGQPTSGHSSRARSTEHLNPGLRAVATWKNMSYQGGFLRDSPSRKCRVSSQRLRCFSGDKRGNAGN